MSWDYDGQREPKDRTKLLWLGISLLIVLMIGVMWASRGAGSALTRARVKHILVDFERADPSDRARALETVTRLRERLVDGESFGKLASEYSGDPISAARGGDLGWVDKGTLTKSVEDYVWSAPVGQLSDVVLSGFGFHLIVVTERQISDVDIYERGLMDRAVPSDTTGN